MKLGDIGEFGLIKRFAPQFLKDLPDGVMGIGDDCAVFPAGGLGADSADDLHYLVTTDLLVQNIHFLMTGISAQDLGHKALAVNLSDIAGMGGKPMMSFLSLALPRAIEVEWIDEFFAGYHHLSKESGTWLMGGDTTRSSADVVINVVVIGRADPAHIKHRSSAQPGDLVCTTGLTGESGAGLQAILNAWPTDDHVAHCVHQHNHPEPDLARGAFLGEQTGVRSMMDISDGIDSDLRHVLTASGVSAEIDLESIPISGPLAAICEKQGLDPHLLALTAGEDYCLLTTVDPDQYDTINESFLSRFGSPLHAIGRIVAGPGDLTYREGGKPVTLDQRGYDHFAT